MAYLRSTAQAQKSKAKKTPTSSIAYGDFMFIRGTPFRSLSAAVWAME